MRTVFGASVQGASHKRMGLPCQDNYSIRDNKYHSSGSKEKDMYYSGMNDDVCIIAIADGHGSKSCPFSKTGSQTAVNVFCDIMAEFCYKFRESKDGLEKQLRTDGDLIHIAQAIEIDWKKRVQNIYRMNKGRQETVLSPEEENEFSIYKLYGTTLLGMVLTNEFVFSFQLGDGDILLVDEDSVLPVIEQEKILGVETHSISKKSAWKHAVSKLILLKDIRKKPFLFMLSTDGMANSYISESEFHKSCQGYLSMIKEYGAEAIESNLPGWLDEISTQGCGDDTTAVFAFHN